MSFSNNELEELKVISFKIIEKEGLPKPLEIKFKSPVFGAKRQFGQLKRTKSCGIFNYEISITTTSANFIQDSNGRWNQAIGKDLSKEQILTTLAHEMAHLKFWKHCTEHLNYTNHIFNLILKELNTINYNFCQTKSRFINGIKIYHKDESTELTKAHLSLCSNIIIQIFKT